MARRRTRISVSSLRVQWRWTDEDAVPPISRVRFTAHTVIQRSPAWFEVSVTKLGGVSVVDRSIPSRDKERIERALARPLSDVRVSISDFTRRIPQRPEWRGPYRQSVGHPIYLHVPLSPSSGDEPYLQIFDRDSYLTLRRSGRRWGFDGGGRSLTADQIARHRLKFPWNPGGSLGFARALLAMGRDIDDLRSTSRRQLRAIYLSE